MFKNIISPNDDQILDYDIDNKDIVKYLVNALVYIPKKPEEIEILALDILFSLRRLPGFKHQSLKSIINLNLIVECEFSFLIFSLTKTILRWFQQQLQNEWKGSLVRSKTATEIWFTGYFVFVSSFVLA